MSLNHKAWLIALGTLALAFSPAYAAEEEIEVYTASIADKGELDMSLHMNYVPSGEAGGEFAGGEASLHRVRITPEISYGLGGGFEVAAYLPLITIASDGVVRAHGAIARLEWIAPHKPTGFFWGGQVEAGRVSSKLEENPWRGELKGIAGWQNARWTLAVNPTVSFAIAGPEPSATKFGINSKISYKLTHKFALGIESYNGTGEIRDGINFAENEQSTFAVIDAPVGKWFVHAGLGVGYGGNRDHMIAVLSLGIPLPQLKR